MDFPFTFAPRRYDDGGATLDQNPGNTAITTFTGLVFDVFNELEWHFDIDDIIRALSNTCRFQGQVEYYSVAEHSVRVMKMIQEMSLTPRTHFLALMHDATEAYLGDIPTPIKKQLRLETSPGVFETFSDVERRLFSALMRTHGFDPGSAVYNAQLKLVKEADYAVYLEERSERPKVGMGLPPYAAEDHFRSHYHRLNELIHGI